MKSGGDLADIRPRPDPAVVAKEVGAELVLVHTRTGMVHVLNPTAAMLWRFFDGDASLDDLANDLAEGFGAPVEEVRRDVLAMTLRASEAHLLEEERSDERPTPRGPDGLVEGTLVNLPLQPSRQRSLLVNWSASCAFCERILPELAALDPWMERHDVGVVLFDGGEAEATSRLLAEHQLAAQVAGTDKESSPFGGMGTPVAYLLDAECRIASPLALGSAEVIDLARSVIGDEDGAPRFLPVRGGVCGPSAARRPSHGQQPIRGFEIGSYRIGIRASSGDADRVLSAALGAYQLQPATGAPENFTVLFAVEGRRPTELNLLMSGPDVLARTRSPRRLMRALARHLSCLLEPAPGLLRLDATGAIIEGRGVILPRLEGMWLGQLQRPMAALGIALVDEPFVHVDPATAELVLGEPAVRLDDGALAGLADPDVRGFEPSEVPGGRYPIGFWLLANNGRDGEILTPGIAAARALGTLVAEPEELVGYLPAVLALLAGIEVVPVAGHDPADLLSALRQIRI